MTDVDSVSMDCEVDRKRCLLPISENEEDYSEKNPLLNED
jgi:hypothetical protein